MNPSDLPSLQDLTTPKASNGGGVESPGAASYTKAPTPNLDTLGVGESGVPKLSPNNATPTNATPQSPGSDMQTQVNANIHGSKNSDSDLKKLYAIKARQVMRDYADDPYTATKMIEKVKIQYMRDVYHKEIKPISG